MRGNGLGASDALQPLDISPLVDSHGERGGVLRRVHRADVLAGESGRVLSAADGTAGVASRCAPWLLLAAITEAVVVLRRKCPYLLVGWLWYLGMLVPVIGLVQVGRQSMADRYTYFHRSVFMWRSPGAANN